MPISKPNSTTNENPPVSPTSTPAFTAPNANSTKKSTTPLTDLIVPSMDCASSYQTRTQPSSSAARASPGAGAATGGSGAAAGAGDAGSAAGR